MVLIAAGCNSNQPATTSSSSGGFNADLVIPKQKCQDDYKKWSQKTGEYNGGFDQAIRAHFNATLNTCLVDYMNTALDANKLTISQTSKVIDIYNSDKSLLELDIYTQAYNGIKPGLYLYENGNQVKSFFGDPKKKFDEKRAALFEEPAPSY